MNTLVCWKCGASLAALTLPLRRLEECTACHAELHVCRMCVEYDTSVAKSCREPIAEEVKEKDRANFCDYFKPRPDAYRPRDQTEERKSRAALDAMFGGQAGTAGGESAGDSSRARLEDLFKKK
jgi:hypothetical protein